MPKLSKVGRLVGLWDEPGEQKCASGPVSFTRRDEKGRANDEGIRCRTH